jgi:hypothetical protein
MVTVDFAKSAGISLCALIGMIIGFKLQDDYRKQSEARVNRRVEEEFLKQLTKKTKNDIESNTHTNGLR